MRAIENQLDLIILTTRLGQDFHLVLNNNLDRMIQAYRMQVILFELAESHGHWEGLGRVLVT